MSSVATAVVGGAVVGGLINSSASRSAASQQADAANNAAAAQQAATTQSNQMQWNMYQQNLANQSPYMYSGQNALAALNGAMGLGSPITQAGGIPGQYQPSRAPIVASPSGGYVQPGAANSTVSPVAAPAQVGPDGSTPVAAAIKSTLGTVTPPAAGAIQQPVSSGINGVSSNPTLNYGATNASMQNASQTYAGQLSTPFSPSMLNMDPSYQFRLQQGQQSLAASAAARGLLGSGQNMKDINDYAQQSASQGYQQAFNNYTTNQTNLFNRLSSIAGIGQTATNQAGAAGMQTGSNMANTTMAGTAASNNYMTGAAAAGAAGTMGSANAISNGINGGIGNYMGSQYLNNMNNGNPAGTVTIPGTPTPGPAQPVPTPIG